MSAAILVMLPVRPTGRRRERSGGAGAERLARPVQRVRHVQRHRQLFRGIPGRLQLHGAVALGVRRRGRRLVSQYCRRHVDLSSATDRHGELCGAGRVFRQAARPRRLCAKSWRQLIGCSMRPAAWPSATTNSPARRCRHAGRRHRGPGPGRKPVPGAARRRGGRRRRRSLRCRRIGPRGSNICSPITATAASHFRPARSVSIPISCSANCASGSTTGSTAMRATPTIPP